jgi:hypothetical protein
MFNTIDTLENKLKESEISWKNSIVII